MSNVVRPPCSLTADKISLVFLACVAGARRGTGIGKSGTRSARAARRGGGQGGGRSACRKLIVWFVFHGRFPIVKTGIGQN